MFTGAALTISVSHARLPRWSVSSMHRIAQSHATFVELRRDRMCASQDSMQGLTVSRKACFSAPSISEWNESTAAHKTPPSTMMKTTHTTAFCFFCELRLGEEAAHHKAIVRRKDTLKTCDFVERAQRAGHADLVDVAVFTLIALEGLDVVRQRDETVLDALHAEPREENTNN
eukprot:PhM_4_TR12300/c1_g1_i1/m.76787